MTAGVQKITPKTDIMCFVEDADFSYQDFAKRGLPSEIPTFRADVSQLIFLFYRLNAKKIICLCDCFFCYIKAESMVFTSALNTTICKKFSYAIQNQLLLI